MSAYLDNSATTKPTKQVADKVYEMLTQKFGNPSSFHKEGLDAQLELRSARDSIAKALSCESEEIVFTSGGTEANNLAIFGAVQLNRRKGKRIVTTAIEHESVLQSIDVLEQQGYDVVRLEPDNHGNITEQQIFDAVNSDTILVSIMYVNNEVGSVMPVQSIKKAVTKAGSPALIHIDCVQAFGKIDVKPAKLKADLVTVTAHKIHGPKGTGALYVRKGVKLPPRSFGGEQEKKLRPGTEASPLIPAFGVAAAQIKNLSNQIEDVHALNLYAKQQLSKIEGIIFNSDDNASDYILNFYVPSFMTSQTIVQHLSATYGVYISSGSACAKGKKSHVLTAMHLPDKIIEHSVRVSFSRFSQKEDVDALVSAIDETVKLYPIK